jgi:hypothetical protein
VRDEREPERDGYAVIEVDEVWVASVDIVWT